MEERALDAILPASLRRETIEGECEVSEVDVVRHFTRLSKMNLSIDAGLYPLGSCTMKHNPRINEEMARVPGLRLGASDAAGAAGAGVARSSSGRSSRALKEIFGMPRVTLQPVAGAHGELTGILMVQAALAKQGNPRKYILIPDSAHGTNPASAAFAGYRCRQLKSNARGTIDLDLLEKRSDRRRRRAHADRPEHPRRLRDGRSAKIADILHEKGAYLYCDGANLNAFVGVARPGDMGIDVLHSNLHKTFSTPHGGGGPGAGPVGVSERLIPFLPDADRRSGARTGRSTWTTTIPTPSGASAHGTATSACSCARFRTSARWERKGFAASRRSRCSMRTTSARGSSDSYHLPYDAPSLHEVVFSDKWQGEKDVHTLDIAKRLMDYGFHPPTIYFPLIVSGALMIEPTEIGAEGRAGRVLRRDDRDREGSEGDSGAGPLGPAHDSGPPPRRSPRRAPADPPLEAVGARPRSGAIDEIPIDDGRAKPACHAR